MRKKPELILTKKMMMKIRKRDTLLSEEKRKRNMVSLDTVEEKKLRNDGQEVSSHLILQSSLIKTEI